MTPENVEKAVRLLHGASENLVEGMKALMEITQLQQQEIKALKIYTEVLKDRIDALADRNNREDERAYLASLDAQDGEWYRKANDLG